MTKPTTPTITDEKNNSLSAIMVIIVLALIIGITTFVGYRYGGTIKEKFQNRQTKIERQIDSSFEGQINITNPSDSIIESCSQDGGTLTINTNGTKICQFENTENSNFGEQPVDTTTNEATKGETGDVIAEDAIELNRVSTTSFETTEPLPVIDNSETEDTKVSLIGLPVSVAEQLAKEKNIPFRVASLNGIKQPLTKDYNPERVNAEVVDGIVESAYFG